MRKTWENVSTSPKPNVQGEGAGDGRGAKGNQLESLPLPKTWGCGRPIPGSGSGLRLPRRSLERLTALQGKGGTNNLKVNCVQE